MGAPALPPADELTAADAAWRLCVERLLSAQAALARASEDGRAAARANLARVEAEVRDAGRRLAEAAERRRARRTMDPSPATPRDPSMLA